VTYRDDGYGSQVRGKIQDPGGFLLIEGTHPTTAQSQGCGGQEDVFRRRCRVLKAVKF